ncbi:putative rRNA methylase YtqB [Porphyridium purpureum]|uniref:Putative rRNA methylase YtqB n=1 Tax=Porphyridium purpureum TaxID=35688 RepID=A0A5J4Z3B2_PORPP|nr:putative rRNA methylase YtqB [Porphyridium purpureum]|eukprot:POR6664..scf295_1
MSKGGAGFCALVNGVRAAGHGARGVRDMWSRCAMCTQSVSAEKAKKSSARCRVLTRSAKFWHVFAAEAVRPGDAVLDATVGNGHDTLHLARMVGPEGTVYGLDIQDSALTRTRERLDEAFPPNELLTDSSNSLRPRIVLEKRSHETFPESIRDGDLALVVYNLGFLPGTDPLGEQRRVTTRADTTVQSLHMSLQKLRVGGLIVVTCYIGHEHGLEEQKAVLDWATNLTTASTVHMKWLNRDQAPSVVLIEKTAQTASGNDA